MWGTTNSQQQQLKSVFTVLNCAFPPKKFGQPSKWRGKGQRSKSGEITQRTWQRLLYSWGKRMGKGRERESFSRTFVLRCSDVSVTITTTTTAAAAEGILTWHSGSKLALKSTKVQLSDNGELGERRANTNFAESAAAAAGSVYLLLWQHDETFAVVRENVNTQQVKWSGKKWKDHRPISVANLPSSVVSGNYHLFCSFTQTASCRRLTVCVSFLMCVSMSSTSTLPYLTVSSRLLLWECANVFAQAAAL